MQQQKTNKPWNPSTIRALFLYLNVSILQECLYCLKARACECNFVVLQKTCNNNKNKQTMCTFVPSQFDSFRRVYARPAQQPCPPFDLDELYMFKSIIMIIHRMYHFLTKTYFYISLLKSTATTATKYFIYNNAKKNNQQGSITIPLK